MQGPGRTTALAAKNWLIAAALMAAIAGLAATQSAGRANAQGPQQIAIGTATSTGNYFRAGAAICRLLQRRGRPETAGESTPLECVPSLTSGSRHNVDMLRSRAIAFALVQSDVLHQAYHGTDAFSGRRSDNLRTLFSLHDEPFHLVAGRGTDVGRFADLKGRKVNLGPRGTTTHMTFLQLLNAHGQDPKWLGQPLEIPVDEHATELCDGNIEAFGQITGAPNAQIANVLRRCGASLVAVDSELIRQLVAEQPFYSPSIISRKLYPGLQDDVASFAVLATMVTTAETPEPLVYSVVRGVFEGLDDLKAMAPALAGIEPARMIRNGLAAPLHPGALRYYRERGWLEASPPRQPAVAAFSASATAAAPLPAPAAAPPDAAAPAPPAAPPTRAKTRR